MRSLNLTVALAALFLSGCTGLATHHSARPMGKGNMEVGFSAAAPTYTGAIATVSAVGASEGYIRYGLGNRVDGTFNAGPTSMGLHADVALIAKDRFNFSTGLGLGLVSAKVASKGLIAAEFDVVGDAFGGELPGGAVAGFGPDFNMKASFGSEENEGTIGFRAAYFGGGVGTSASQGTTGGANSSGGGLVAGPIFSFTHRGERLIVTPELDLFFGRYMIQAQQDVEVPYRAAFIVPSITFAMAK